MDYPQRLYLAQHELPPRLSEGSCVPGLMAFGATSAPGQSTWSLEPVNLEPTYEPLAARRSPLLLSTGFWPLTGPLCGKPTFARATVFNRPRANCKHILQHNPVKRAVPGYRT